MGLRTAITGFLDTTIDSKFKRDSQGRLIYFPASFGRGRVVPDAASEAHLRAVSRKVLIYVFVGLIPLAGALGGLAQPSGLGYLAYFGLCLLFGALASLYPVWDARNLPRSDERRSYGAAATQSLDLYSTRFLVFGLAMSCFASLASAAMLAFPSHSVAADPIMSIVSLVVFVPLAAFYAAALVRRRQSPPAAQ